MLFSCGVGFVVDTDAANYIMRGCCSFVATQSSWTSGEDAFLQGKCIGTVSATVNLAEDVCPPNGSTAGQALRIVVKYIRLERTHEMFVVLARKALRAAWPCNK
jgi:hypothetical protein